MPISLANAGKCSAALVEPPLHATTLAAFTKDFLLTISLGLICLSINFITETPESYAYTSLDSYGAGVDEEPGIARPIASATHAIVLAVNWPPQDPADGQATFSKAQSSFSEIFFASYSPTASNTS